MEGGGIKDLYTLYSQLAGGDRDVGELSCRPSLYTINGAVRWNSEVSPWHLADHPWLNSWKTATCSLPRLLAESCKNLWLYDHLIWHTGLHGGQDYHVVWILHEEKLSTAQHDGKVKQDLT